MENMKQAISYPFGDFQKYLRSNLSDLNVDFYRDILNKIKVIN